MEKYKLPKLNDRDNDLTKQWYVEYQFLHPETDVYVRFREWISMRLKTGVARREKATEIKDRLSKWLKKGGNPFRDQEIGGRELLKTMDHILALKKTSTSQRTYSTYKSAYKHFTTYLSGIKKETLRLSDMNLDIALDFMDWIKLSRKLSNRSYNNVRTNLQVFFNEMQRRNYITVNPFAQIALLPETEPTILMFAPSELKKIKTVLRDEDFRLYCVAGLIFYCALRPAEIMRLKVKDFYLEEKAIHIGGAQTKNKKGAWINIPNARFAEDLKRLGLENYNEEWYVFNRHLVPAPKETAPTRIAERWRIWANAKGIKRCIYDLKHTVAGMSQDNGMPARDLQLHFRHSSLDVTQKYLDRFRRAPGPGFLKYPKM